jgi:hypothetical protein
LQKIDARNYDVVITDHRPFRVGNER